MISNNELDYESYGSDYSGDYGSEQPVVVPIYSDSDGGSDYSGIHNTFFICFFSRYNLQKIYPVFKFASTIKFSHQTNLY